MKCLWAGWAGVVVFAFFCSGLRRAQADSIFVEQATGSGVNAGDLSTARELIRVAIPEVSSDTVVDQADKADFALRPTLIKLGEAVILSLSKVKDGKTLFSSQLKAARMDELDQVANRLTRSVLTGERASSNPRVGEITDQEAKDGTQRRPTRGETYVGFGGASFSHLNSSGIGYSIAVGYAWDLNTALIKVLGQGDINGSALFLGTALGGNYFLSTGDVAPYVGADFGLGLAKIDAGGVTSGQTIGGFMLGAGAGVHLLRSAAVNLDLGLRFATLLRSNDLGYPSTTTLRLGIYF